MTTYKQITRLDWHDIQRLCIERSWYTCGTSEDFKKLQDSVWGFCEEHLEEPELIRFLQRTAEDIKAHSDTEYEVADIMTALNLKCRRWFEEA